MQNFSFPVVCPPYNVAFYVNDITPRRFASGVKNRKLVKQHPLVNVQGTSITGIGNTAIENQTFPYSEHTITKQTYL